MREREEKKIEEKQMYELSRTAVLECLVHRNFCKFVNYMQQLFVVALIATKYHFWAKTPHWQKAKCFFFLDWMNVLLTKSVHAPYFIHTHYMLICRIGIRYKFSFGWKSVRHASIYNDMYNATHTESRV